MAFIDINSTYCNLVFGRQHFFNSPLFAAVFAFAFWGGLALMLSFPGRMAMGKTDLWLSFAAWLVR